MTIDFPIILNELDKIILYSLESDSISMNTIKKNIQLYNDDDIFHLIDNIMKKNYSISIKTLREILKTTPIQSIIYNLIEKFNNFLVIKKISLRLKYPQPEVISQIAQKDYKINLNYYAIKNSSYLLKKYDEKLLSKIIKTLIEIDTISKSSPVPFPESALEIFIKKICES